MHSLLLLHMKKMHGLLLSQMKPLTIFLHALKLVATLGDLEEVSF